MTYPIATPDPGRFWRLVQCAADAERDDLARGMLNAYVACLSFDDLLDAAVLFLGGPAPLRRALRNRLTRRAAKASPEALDSIGTRLLGLAPLDRLSRTTLDTLLPIYICT